MIRAIIIVEMMGRPKEHLAEAIKGYISQMDKFKGLKTINREYSEPKIVDEKKDLHTCFCEVEFECPDFKQLIEVVFDFMPSSIEIVEPANVSLSIDEATSVMNLLSGRLHRYDDVVKIMKNREDLFNKEIGIASKILNAYDMIDSEGKIKKEVIEKANAKIKQKNEEVEKEKNKAADPGKVKIEKKSDKKK